METDFSIDTENAPDKLAELGKKWAVAHGRERKDPNLQTYNTIAAWQKIRFTQVFAASGHYLWPVKKEFYDNECDFTCEVVKEHVYEHLGSEEFANELLEMLLANKFLFDGYVYTSKYGDVVLFGIANKLYVNGTVFTGEWE